MLNLPGYQSTAAIVAEIQDTRGEAVAYHANYIFQISDCTRVVTLDLESFRTEDGRHNNLHKVDTMIDVLKAFRKGLAIEQRRYAKAHPGDNDDDY